MSTASDEIFRLALELVNIPSVTGEEGACCRFMAGYLASRGWKVEEVPVSSGRFDVFASQGQPDVVLSTHLDTVPPFIPAREDEEFISGRGSCDAKGIAASQVAAAEGLVREGFRDIGLLFVVGEETVSDGATAANLVPRGSRYLINGEPTSNKLVLGTKGVLRVDISTQGKMAHSAFPGLGESAIEKLLDVLADVRKLPLPEDQLLGPTTLNIGIISGGCAPNVIPGEASAQLLLRTVPGKEREPSLKEEIRRLLDGRCEYQFVRETSPMRMEKLDGFETDVVPFCTDVPSLTRWGRPFLMGPGSIEVAHTDHERVRKEDLIQAVDLYCRAVRILKSRTEPSSAYA